MQNQNNSGNSFKLFTFPQFGTNTKTSIKDLDNQNLFVTFAPDKNQREDVEKCFIKIYKNFKKTGIFLIDIFSKTHDYKLDINTNNIEALEIESSKKNPLFKNFYFFLTNPPKVYKKVKNKKLPLEENYLENFKKFLKENDFTNHYEFTYEVLDDGSKMRTIVEKLNVEHYKKDENDIDSENSDENSDEEEDNISNNNLGLEIEDDFLEENELINDETSYNKNSYLRIDSFFSKSNEYTNFYLLNLIMKIKIEFESEEEYEQFIHNFKLSKHFSKNINKNKELITTIKADQAEKVNNFLANKKDQFYLHLLNLHYNLQYAILCLITNKRLNIFCFPIDLLVYFSTKNFSEQEEASIILEYMIKNIIILDNQENLLQEYFQYEKMKEIILSGQLSSVNEENMKTRTIEITPSLIYYRLPIYEKLNHILRKYAEYKDNFVKINFIDEENNRVYGSSELTRILINFQKNALLNGVIIGSRIFKFLSASNSQMKNSSYWFFCLEGTRFYKMEQIIEETGDYTKELNINKNAARRGQNLSTTSFIKIMNPANIAKITDIERNGYVFTDGIGKISSDLAREIANMFKLEFASAFQIRIGGIKGMLAVDPLIEESDVIHVRPSMIKFDSPNTELGVVRCSSFSQGFLNRQIIILLSTLGVPDEVFMHMLKDEYSKYVSIINNPEKLLDSNDDYEDYINNSYYFSPLVSFYFKSLKYLKEINSHNKYNSLITNLTKLPFVSNLLLTISVAKLKDLKSKGRILDKDSVILIGVIDETETLEEDEVFVQIAKEDNSEFCLENRIKSYKEISILDNITVIVTKNPCLHPGDIKLLKAVNNKKVFKNLGHMLNVVVFSSKGFRPVPNKISGGDLDGDLYFVSWNRILIDNIKIKDYPPLRETKNSNKTCSKKEIKMKDIVNSYINYMINDTVGIISNAHSAFADKDVTNKAFNEKCLKLAELFSIAIDAPKHGNFVSRAILKQNKLSLENYTPDFLENNSKNVCSFNTIYESPGILGKLFRTIEFDKIIQTFNHNEYLFSYLQQYEIDFSFISSDCHLYALTAYEIYKKFSNQIKNLMITYKISSETELFLFVDLYDGKNKNIHRYDPTNFYIQLNNLRDFYIKYILKSFNVDKINVHMASALYFVTYINAYSAKKFHKTFVVNYKNLIGKMIEEKMIGISSGNNNEGKLSKEEYNQFIFDNLDDKKIKKIVNTKKIFSLPWLIKDVRDELFKLAKL